MAEEAKEVVIITLSTDAVKPCRHSRQNSPVSSISSGSPDLLSDEEAIPRYLRPSKGSCHDFCKYGIKDINEAPRYFSKKKDLDEAKERLCTLPKTLWSKKMLDGEHSLTDASMIRERRKKSEVNLRTRMSLGRLKIEFKDELGQTELPPEKLIFVSDPPMKKNAEGSTQQSSSMKHNGMLHSQVSYEQTSEESTSIERLTPSSIKDCRIADEHEAVKLSRLLSNLSDSIEDPGTTAENVNQIRTDMLANNQVKDLSVEPVSIKYVISPPTLETIASHEDIEVNQSEGLAARTASVPENVASGEHGKGSRAEKSANNLIEKKNKVLLRSTRQSTIAELEVNGRKSHAIQRRGNPLGANNNVSVLSLRTSSLRNNSASALSPADRSNKEDHHSKTLSVEKKSKRQENKIGCAQNKAVVPAVAEKDKRPALKKLAVKLVKLEIVHEISPTIKKATESARNKVIKKKPLASSKISASVEPVTSDQLKKEMSESPLSSSFSRDLTTENDKVKLVSRIMKGNKDHLSKPLSSSPFLNSHLSPVSSKTKCRYRITSPTITNKDQVKARRLGLKNKISGDLKPKPQMVDLNAINRNLRRSASSARKSSEANEQLLHKKVTRSSNSPKIEEIKRERKEDLSLHYDDNQSISHRLYLNNVNATDRESESISPVSLKSRLVAKTITDETSPKLKNRGRAYANKAEVSDGVAAATSFGDPTVVRRGGDIQDIKHTRGLFNHVIEETASELIKTRRSRVKALVGAFETVISLQES